MAPQSRSATKQRVRRHRSTRARTAGSAFRGWRERRSTMCRPKPSDTGRRSLPGCLHQREQSHGRLLYRLRSAIRDPSLGAAAPPVERRLRVLTGRLFQEDRGPRPPCASQAGRGLLRSVARQWWSGPPPVPPNPCASVTSSFPRSTSFVTSASFRSESTNTPPGDSPSRCVRIAGSGTHIRRWEYVGRARPVPFNLILGCHGTDPVPEIS